MAFWRWLFVSLIVLDVAPAAQATDVCWPITTSTTWFYNQQPYIATSTVTVSNNATLTIEPGVQVKFNASTGLVLGSGTAGILNAVGTALAPITFTSNSATPAPGDWSGLRFDQTTSSSICDRCVIEYGGADIYNANVRLGSSTPTIRRSRIQSSDGYGIYVTGSEYDGRHGRSLTLDGKEGSNDSAEDRSVVLHGADYVSDQYARENGRVGNSWGCPAVDYRYRDEIINKIGNGSVMLIYAT